MNTIVLICAIFGLAFVIKQADGPWDLIARWRNWIMRLPLIGPQFYKLLDCYYCTGFWAGLSIYFVSQESYKLSWALCWGLAGGVVSLIMDAVLTFLHRE
jgi:hypothetical protein